MSESAAHGSSGYAGAAIRGSSWTALQVVVNKAAAAAATVSLGFLLEAQDFGLAWFAVSAGLLVSMFHVVAFGDVLLALPTQFEALSLRVGRLARIAACAQAIIILGAGLLLSFVYPERVGLLGLMGVVACRPMMDALTVVPLAAMRRSLRYREISTIDAVTALLASVLVVLLAWLGAGPYAIVLPPILLTGIRSLAYRRLVGPPEAPIRTAERDRLLVARVAASSVGSYLAGVLFLLETLVLGLFVGDRSLGLFSFAFGLASQVNSIVSFQIAGALQPILGHLGNDPARQVDGLVRAARIISCVLVPLLLTQAAVGGCFIRAMWPGKWDDSILVFQVISIGQALYVCQWPSAFLLKSQGRFIGYLKIQAVNIVLAGIAFAVAATLGPAVVQRLSASAGSVIPSESQAPLAVAVVAVVILAVLGPVVFKFAGRPAGLPWRTVLQVLWGPWLTAAPIAIAAWFAATHVGSMELSRPLGAFLAIVLGAAFGAAGVTLSVFASRPARADAAAVVRLIRGRLLGPAASGG